MKRLFAMIIFFVLMVSSCAFASVKAIPNQKLSFRTGPNTKYTEMFTLPQSTEIIAHEMEVGNDVIWILCEFMYNGNSYFGYTGLKRMSLLGEIDYAYHDYTPSRVTQTCTVYSSPYIYNAIERGRVICNEVVNLLRYDDQMAFVEFYDSSSKRISRGWIDSNCVDLYYGFSSSVASESAKVFSGPGNNYSSIGRIGENELIMAGENYGNYREILFYSSRTQNLEYGYVQASVIDWLF